LLFNLPSTITPNQLLLCIPCFKLVALQLAINDHYKRAVYSVFLVSSLLHFNLLLTITANSAVTQKSISYLNGVALQLVTNYYC